MGSFVNPEGWHFWSKNEDVNRVKFVEYNNFGPGADVRQRVAWSQLLSKKEASRYNKENIFAPYSWEIASGTEWYNTDFK